jgi:hypothetical protein
MLSKGKLFMGLVASKNDGKHCVIVSTLGQNATIIFFF